MSTNQRTFCPLPYDLIFWRAFGCETQKKALTDPTSCDRTSGPSLFLSPPPRPIVLFLYVFALFYCLVSVRFLMPSVSNMLPPYLSALTDLYRFFSFLASKVNWWIVKICPISSRFRFLFSSFIPLLISLVNLWHFFLYPFFIFLFF